MRTSSLLHSLNRSIATKFNCYKHRSYEKNRFIKQDERGTYCHECQLFKDGLHVVRNANRIYGIVVCVINCKVIDYDRLRVHFTAGEEVPLF